MAQPRAQTSFNKGEWAPALLARTDLEGYRSAAALLRNFFVDYRGGASTRTGTKYILHAKDSTAAVRLIPFQASSSVTYVLEFGANYIEFYNNGAPVLEGTIAITGATQANPCVVSVVNTYAVGQRVYITGVGGMTQLNGRYFIISARTGGTITLQDLFGVAVNSTSYGAYTAGGTVQRIYAITSPYAAADLALLKFVQNVNSLILVHPSYAPYVLTINAATNWTLSPIVFGSTVGTPTGTAAATSLAAGTANYSYIVTASDVSGQESGPSAAATLANIQDIRTVAGTNTVTWNAVSGATSYNVYRAEISFGAAVPSGAAYGFIGNATGTTFKDSNIAPDFSVTPPVTQNPFSGASVVGVTITAGGAYTVAPTVTFAAPPSGHTATGAPIFTLSNTVPNAGGAGYVVGNRVAVAGLGSTEWNVLTTGGGGSVTSVGLTAISPPPVVTGTLPTNPLATTTNGVGVGCTLDLTWAVTGILLSSGGDGYLAAPAITFSAGAAAATALLGTASNGNPSCCGFINQRLVLAGPTGNPQQFNMSQPGAPYNFDISNPLQDDDAISAQLASGQLNSIKSMVPMPSGLIMMSDRQGWLINGGANGAAVTATGISANTQSYIGAGDLPPIVSNFDMLFVQAKGSIVRDMSYNFYANVWTGTDVSIMASHFFFGHSLTEWAWAEEPFKVVWAVRNDGVMLTLTFLKEQEFVGWASSTTDGLFKSVAVVQETVSGSAVDAVYVVVERTINSQTVKYIERFTERDFTVLGYRAPWSVDAGLRYVGSPATTFTGGEHLKGETVTGLADGIVITPFVMPASGSFTLATAASVVVVGLPYTCDLQTMPLDLGPGEATVQSKPKKINAVDVRVTETLGIKIGTNFDNLVPMKDLILGNVSSMRTGLNAGSQIVSDLVSGDARTYIDPRWTVLGQYCIRQDQPYPATILGVYPQVSVGDTPGGGK